LIPQQPQQPRPLTTARDVIVWVILQDAMGGAYRDPVTVPEGVVPWIAQVMQMRRYRELN
jgi:hypothetical protein